MRGTALGTVAVSANSPARGKHPFWDGPRGAGGGCFYLTELWPPSTIVTTSLTQQEDKREVTGGMGVRLPDKTPRHLSLTHIPHLRTDPHCLALEVIES